mgnify:CR=1 FL=1
MKQQRVPLTDTQIEQFDKLKLAICNYTGLSKEEFDQCTIRGGKLQHAYARRIFIYISIMFVKNKFKLQRTSTYLNLDHSTVKYHYDKAIEQIDVSEVFQNDVKECLWMYRQHEVIESQKDEPTTQEESEAIQFHKKKIMELKRVNELQRNTIEAHKLAIEKLRKQHEQQLKRKPLPLF